jgi:iron complex transport system substrate-binding protein
MPDWFAGGTARFAAALVALSSPLLAGCGNEAGSPAASSTAASPAITVDAANGRIVLASVPRRIVSLSASATEDLYAVGAGGQVVAVDAYSTHPSRAPRTKLSGFKPNIEAVAAYRPDLVVVSDDTNTVVEQLGKLGVPVLVEPTPALTVFHELDQTYFSVTSKTFIGQLYRLLGLRNVADQAKSGSPYPQLSAEYVIASRPDLIVLADTKCCGQSAETVAKRPGWTSIPAVVRGDVVAVDDSVASEWGPRIVLFFAKLARIVRGMESGG